ncbi:hypothetical protein HYH03_010599 [Edaphochlamys debaryana]|uniref:Uncharacterized protein n=1 Tax=Edaphochlamys debaryana TaxID=47281 RepID=A0A835XWL5_9CHLO|nr:hypothetical protein HYH03_010599 [Edaphochlamys debaryana]|eukprot:KAG2491159.1 hypothetical protein HYH03_010599 [Edaphochlamys debaryana]
MAAPAATVAPPRSVAATSAGTVSTQLVTSAAARSSGAPLSLVGDGPLEDEALSSYYDAYDVTSAAEAASAQAQAREWGSGALAPDLLVLSAGALDEGPPRDHPAKEAATATPGPAQRAEAARAAALTAAAAAARAHAAMAVARFAGQQADTAAAAAGPGNGGREGVGGSKEQLVAAWRQEAAKAGQAAEAWAGEAWNSATRAEEEAEAAWGEGLLRRREKTIGPDAQRAVAAARRWADEAAQHAREASASAEAAGDVVVAA